MNLVPLETEIETAVTNGTIPGVVLAVASANGNSDYIKTFGSVLPKRVGNPITEDAVFSMASSSKIVTNVAAMQCVERGLITLDTHIADVLPQWKEAQVLKGFDSAGEPILTPVTEPITLAQLLTHTSGIAFLESSEIHQYYKAIGHPAPGMIEEYFSTNDRETHRKLLPQIHDLMSVCQKEPLLFQPGQGWVYGYGQEWGGEIVHALTKLSLEDFCRKNIFEPLGMHSATFRQSEHPELEEKLVPMMMRDKDGVLSETERIWPGRTDMGGSGLCCSAPDFLKLLASLLRNDEKILQRASVDTLLGYRLPNRGVMESKDVKEFFEDMVSDKAILDHCIAGAINVDIEPETGRSAGSVFWCGASSTFWWIDRAAGICGFYASQAMAGRERGISRGMYTKFEKAVYDSIRARH